MASIFNSLSLEAPAKVNLTLRITGKKEDGYHLLNSMVVFADVADRLSFESHDRLTLEISGPFRNSVVASEDNLVIKAAHCLAEAVGLRATGRIVLEKNLPVASGIGGGSSNAAATFLALNILWDTGFDDIALRTLGLSLGADIPVCLWQRPAIIGGTGEEILPVTMKSISGLVLINPGVSVSTPEVFRLWSGAFSEEIINPPASINTAQELAAFISESQNDLEFYASSVCPVIEVVLNKISEREGCLISRLSGSGATCFGLFDTVAAAVAGAKSIRRQRPDWWVRVTKIRSAE